MGRVPAAAAVGLALLLASATAGATYSVGIVDTKTGDMGAAVASCISLDVSFVYRAVPERGLVLAQAYYYEPGRDRAAALLRDGQSPHDVVTAISDPKFDPDAQHRQYAIIDMRGTVAAYTGSGVESFAGSRQGRRGALSYSVQGNILNSEGVLRGAASSLDDGGTYIPDKLMLALEAGAEHGQGDARCTPQGRPATSAYLRFDPHDGTEGVVLNVLAGPGENAVVKLRAQYDGWRATQVSRAGRSGCRGCGVAGNDTPLFGGALTVLVLVKAMRRMRRR